MMSPTSAQDQYRKSRANTFTALQFAPDVADDELPLQLGEGRRTVGAATKARGKDNPSQSTSESATAPVQSCVVKQPESDGDAWKGGAFEKTTGCMMAVTCSHEGWRCGARTGIPLLA